MRSIAVALLLSASFCVAQESGDFKSATSNVLDAQYPKIDSSSRVQIHLAVKPALRTVVSANSHVESLGFPRRGSN